jgi:hypothetical protein
VAYLAYLADLADLGECGGLAGGGQGLPQSRGSSRRPRGRARCCESGSVGREVRLAAVNQASDQHVLLRRGPPGPENSTKSCVVATGTPNPEPRARLAPPPRPPPRSPRSEEPGTTRGRSLGTPRPGRDPIPHHGRHNSAGDPAGGAPVRGLGVWLGVVHSPGGRGGVGPGGRG